MKLTAATLAAAIAGVIVLTLVSLVVFQDNFARFLANPRTPFQTVTPPPAPNYDEPGAWLLWPEEDEAPIDADVFYVHSTTYYSPDGWNAPVNDVAADALVKQTAAPNEVGPFLNVGPIYSPRYRQATMFAFFTHKFDGVAARKLAYEDVRRAFMKFVEVTDPSRPFILVGYGQGGLHLEGLIREFLQDDEDLRGRLAAAYVIGQGLPLRLFDSELANTPPCVDAEAVRCVISYVDFERQFDEEMERVRRRTMNWNGAGELIAAARDPLLCINPLTWDATSDYVSADNHVGAASATGLRFGSTPPALSRAIGAKCVDGILVVDTPTQEFLRRGAWFGVKWRAQNFNLFYFDLADDARRRVRNVSVILEEEAKYLDPIEDSVDLNVSPINKVPRLP